jgi:dipeptidyl aminopeptidase/acylaminoacyl peptidase
VLYSSNQGDLDRRHLWRVDLVSRKPQPITQGNTVDWSPVEAGPTNVTLCLSSTGSMPAMPYVIGHKTRRLIAASALPADFPSAELVVPEQIVFRSEDGLAVHGQLFVKQGLNRSSPALIYIHGGPRRQMLLGFHYLETYHSAYAMNQYLASRGYVVFSVNYRLGTMYGRSFREAPDAGWRSASEYKDILAAVKCLKSLPFVDGNKIALWGGSYGEGT